MTITALSGFGGARNDSSLDEAAAATPVERVAGVTAGENPSPPWRGAMLVMGSPPKGLSPESIGVKKVACATTTEDRDTQRERQR